MKLNPKYVFFFATLTIGLLVSLSANAYLLNELLDIREILDAQYETIFQIMKMLGFQFGEAGIGDTI
tara:strand:- start:792 stop:992 length:201 start_codon:yes stop_codon:yes gene_type:complete